jgi:N-acetylneuraminic acid mutarotase
MKKIILTNIILAFTFLLAFGQGNWTHTDLSTSKVRMGAASLGSKVYFAGGAAAPNYLSTTKIEIYDLNTEYWSTDNLSLARDYPTTANLGSKVFFAGGYDVNSLDFFSRVDTYDTLTGLWTTAELSVPRSNMAAITYGNEVFFAGGVNFATGVSYPTIDIYNSVTGDWTTDVLPSQSGPMNGVLVGAKGLFVGPSGIDIYDFITESWSSVGLPLERGFSAVTAVGNKVIIAGGIITDDNPTDRVDIYDVSTGSWEASNISIPRAFFNYGVTVCGKAFFAGGGNFTWAGGGWTSATNRVDIYDPATGAWTTDQLSHPVVNHAVVANGDRVLVAGGTNFEATEFTTVDIYTCESVGIDVVQPATVLYRVYPNPSSGNFRIEHLAGNSGKPTMLKMMNLQGQVVFTQSLTSGDHEMNVSVPPGVYLLTVASEAGTQTELITIQ